MRYLMHFSYDGSYFFGYQVQQKKRTVQGEVEKVLAKVNHNQPIQIYASGRTDAKVHALNQTAHFDFEQWDVENLKYKLNQLLPKDIYVKKIEEVGNDFHARYHSKKKTYVYKINCGEYNPWERNYVYQYNKFLDIEKMKEASVYFLGEHDFTSFTKACHKYENAVRKLYSISIEEVDSIIEITFCGNGFLQYMVRNMVGILIEVGSLKREPKVIEEILKQKDRRSAGCTAEPVGLYLKEVIYEE